MNYRTLIGEILVYVRATQLSTDIRIRLGLKRSAFLAIGLVFATLALVFFNIAGYAALQSVIGPIWTPALLGSLNLMLMLIVLGVAGSYRTSDDLEHARELQSSSLTQLHNELTSPRPLYGFLDPEVIAELVPIIASLVRAVRVRGKKSKSEHKSAE